MERISSSIAVFDIAYTAFPLLGCATADEEMLTAARRELEEETGLHADNYRLLTILDTTPGFCNEQIGIYLATGLSQHAMHTDDGEFLRVASFPLDEAIRKVMEGEIHDSKTIVGLMMAWQLRHAEKAAPFESFTTIKRQTSAFSSRPSE